jgi:PAS domain S-box-containing protein
MDNIVSIIDKKSFKILVVEDESISAAGVIEMLKSFGYSTIGPVPTGEEAIEKCAIKKPDIVFMDIHLKGVIDGIAAATEIKTRFQIPVIYITAHSDIGTIERVKRTEPYGYILKPFSERDLFLTVEIAVNKILTERQTNKREKWFSTILKSIGDGVIVTDDSGNVVYMNTAAESMTGYSQTEAQKNDLKSIFRILSSENKKKKNQESIDQSGKMQRILSSTVLESKNGKRHNIEYNVASINDAEKILSGGVLVFRDITERQQAQDAVQNTVTMLRKAMSGTIEAMALTVETRDPYTAGHQRRVTDLARAVAEKIGLPLEQIDGIRMAGVIHDLGKISVPAEILSKPGKLSEIEFNLIKIHPQVGYDILKNIDFSWPVANIIYQHHERIDGSGYPNRLSAKEILIEAKIIAVADVVEAMASHRPYRASLGMERAIDEVVQKRGIFYDADVVDACRVVVKEQNFVFG